MFDLKKNLIQSQQHVVIYNLHGLIHLHTHVAKTHILFIHSMFHILAQDRLL